MKIGRAMKATGIVFGFVGVVMLCQAFPTWLPGLLILGIIGFCIYMLLGV